MSCTESTNGPSCGPTNVPTNMPTNMPTNVPTNGPTSKPTNGPTNVPTNGSTNEPNNTLSVMDALYYGLGNPLFFGQIWARSEIFNNSTDIWPLIFTSYIPFGDLIVLLYLSISKTSLKPGVSQKSNNSSPFFDKTIMIPILLKILIESTNIEESKYNGSNIFKYIQYIILISVLVYNNINKINKNCNQGINVNELTLMGKVIMDTTILFCFVELLSIFIPNIISNIPIIGDIFNSIPEGKLRNILLWITFYIIISTHMNYYNQININRFCDTPIIGYNTDFIPFFMFLFFYVYFFYISKMVSE